MANLVRIIRVAKSLGWTMGAQSENACQFFTQDEYRWTVDSYEIAAMLKVPPEDIPKELAAPNLLKWAKIRYPTKMGYTNTKGDLRTKGTPLLFEFTVKPVLLWRLANEPSNIRTRVCSAP